METAIAPVTNTEAALAEQVVIKGNLSALTEEQRMSYYTAVCRSLGLNPLTRPFEYITLNNKLTLYATRAAADQLRALRGITITNLDPRQVGDLLVVVASGRDRSGREDSSTGAVSVKGLGGEALANAMMKAETKAKRRLTLSLAGLGWSDETEIDSIPSAIRTDVDPATGEIRKPLSLAERVAEKAAAVEQPVEAAAFIEDELPARQWAFDRFRDAITSKGLNGPTVKSAVLELWPDRNLTIKDMPSWELTPAEWADLADTLNLT